jgi:hypothetical protein
MEEHVIVLTSLLCDFCNDPAITRSYRTAPVTMKVKHDVLYFCDTEWAACALCARLIDEERWQELSDRSYMLWIRTESRRGISPPPPEREFMRTHIRQLHQLFREARGRTA